MAVEQTMDFDTFTGQVQNRLEHPSTGRTLRSIRATLTTLGERIQEGEAKDLAGNLPMEIDRYLLEADSGQRFDWEEFVGRIWEREGMTDPNDRADAVYHAQVIIDVVDEVVPGSEMDQVRGMLPKGEEWDSLFEIANREAEESAQD